METVSVRLVIQELGADQEYIDKLAHNLRNRLRDIENVADVYRARETELPEGTMAGNAFQPGALIIDLIKTGSISPFLSALSAWLFKDKNRSVKIKIGDNEIEVSNLSAEEQSRLIQWFKEQTSYQWSR